MMVRRRDARYRATLAGKDVRLFDRLVPDEALTDFRVRWRIPEPLRPDGRPGKPWPRMLTYFWADRHGWLPWPEPQAVRDLFPVITTSRRPIGYGYGSASS